MIWERPWFSRTNATARVHFVVFTESKEDMPVDPALDGGPADPRAIPITASQRDDDAFLRTLREIGGRAPSQGNVAAARLARCAAHQFRLELPDPDTLAGLQAVLAHCHAFARRKDTCAIVDMHTGLWWAPDAFAALRPDRAFDVTEHVISLFDGKSGNTRGLAKFARPDCVVRNVGPEQQAATGFLLNLVADGLAAGKAWGPERKVSIVLHGPRGKLPPIAFVPPSPELGTESWGNAFMEVRDFGEQGPGAGCSQILEALAAQI
jgi:hypothetical protein